MKYNDNKKMFTEDYDYANVLIYGYDKSRIIWWTTWINSNMSDKLHVLMLDVLLSVLTQCYIMHN